MANTHTHTQLASIGYEKRTIDRPVESNDFGMNAPNYVALMRKLYLL